MKKIINNFLSSNLILILISFISFIRFIQFRFASDSASYHFAFPVQILKDKTFFDEMNNILWKFPHLADSINLFLSHIKLMHLFWTVIPILNVFFLNKIIRNFYDNLGINYSIIKNKIKIDSIQYISLFVILNGSFLYTIASGHSEQLNLLLLFLSIIIVLPNNKITRISSNKELQKKLNYRFFISGLLIGLAICSKISIIYFLPQVLFLSTLSILYLYKNLPRKKLIIKYLLFSIFSLCFCFFIYLVLNRNVADLFLNIFNFKVDTDFNNSYLNLKDHINSSKLEYEIGFFNSIKYLLKLAISPLNMRFPFYLSWFPNFLITFSIMIFTLSKRFRKRFNIKSKELLCLFTYFSIFLISNNFFFNSGMHNPRHLMIPSIINSLFFVLIFPYVFLEIINFIFNKFTKFCFISFTILILYLELFGLNYPISRNRHFFYSRSIDSEIKNLLKKLDNKKRILNLADSTLNVYSPLVIHYPSPYWQYGIDFNKENINISELINKFDYIIYYLNETSIDKCDVDLSKPYSYKEKDNISKYNELKNILIDCSNTIKSVDFNVYKSNTFRIKTTRKTLVLATLK